MEAKSGPTATSGVTRRQAYFWMSFLLFACLAIVALSVYGYVDATTGTPGTAHITHCETSHTSSKTSSVSCKGTWTLNDHKITGWVDGANYRDLGKDISVRLHGNRATESHLWMPIVLFAFAGPMTIFCIWFMLKIPAKFPAKPSTG